MIIQLQNLYRYIYYNFCITIDYDSDDEIYLEKNYMKR